MLVQLYFSTCKTVRRISFFFFFFFFEKILTWILFVVARKYDSVTNSNELADLWKRIAEIYKSNDKVWFGLMNEPHDVSPQDWFAMAQASINAIRATGATNLITVPGSCWTGAWRYDLYHFMFA